MKVVAFNGSPHHNGNTVTLIQRALGKIAEQGIETELIHLTGKPLRGCAACYQCRERKNRKCAIDSDPINEWLPKMFAADGIIIGSPTYFANLSAEAKAFIDRSGYVSRGNGGLLKRKVGAAIVVARRAGAITVFNAINDFFLINEMIVPGSSYWNIALGREIGDVEADAEGLKTMDILGENMAWLLKRLY
ncbi:MAG TPA: flavodoxin family protein [Bacillota bacterium]|nr:flavodoxin family protein [Bacillota bacterium]